MHRDERLPLNCLFRPDEQEWAERELQSIEGSNNAIKRARRKGKATKRKVKDVTVSKTDLVGLMKAR